VLVEFAERGSFSPRCRPAKNTTLLKSFQQVLQDYLEFSKDHLGHGHRTIRLRRNDVTDFLHYLESKGIQSPTAISGLVVTEFVRSRGSLASATFKNRVAALRSFLRYLRICELIEEDLSPYVPTIRRYRHDRIPSVWTQDEVNALLGTVDRGSPQGKRDYAILLLACRLGMRVGDIRELRLENLLWDEARIEISQAKTGESLNLPMGQELGLALIDYLQHGRPASRHREVFLRLMAPFAPFGTNNNLHHIVSLYRRRAGIEISPRSRRGMHSLRHTVATLLLEEQVPIETIAGILGHQTTESTRIYTKVDIKSLRTAALDPQEVCDA
jgi:site-specific recombinase XerD